MKSSKRSLAVLFLKFSNSAKSLTYLSFSSESSFLNLTLLELLFVVDLTLDLTDEDFASISHGSPIVVDIKGIVDNPSWRL